MSTKRTPAQVMSDAVWRDLAMPRPGEIGRWQRDCRVMGVMVGMACADAAGAPYEFLKPPKFGTAKFGWATFGFEPAEYTDDTQMAVLVCQAKSDPQRTAAGFISWYSGHPRDVGSQTRRVLGSVRTYRGMLASAKAVARQAELAPRPAHFLPGGPNGSLMRCAPTCLPLLGDREAIAGRARQISDLTHADPWSGDACVLWSLAIADAIERGEAWQPADITAGLSLIPENRRAAWSALIEVSLRARTPGGPMTVNGSAFGCFAAALWAVAHAGSYEDTVHLAISCGGDSDTVAAVAGALAGARWGVLEIPSKWYRRVHGWPGYTAVDLARLALEAARR
jgi:ADP-ribosyl-[dinitrogen reductase] hydrolase